MSNKQRIGIIGSGIAGLSCARQLADLGWSPVIFDKGRGIGGRIATRRAPDGAQFDHGAQYITARTTGFQSFVKRMSDSGSLALWEDGSNDPHFVGSPSMTAMAKHLAQGLTILQKVEVTAVQRANGGWVLIANGSEHHFDRVVLTVPAPQAIALLEGNEPISSEISNISFDPCLTLMAVLDTKVSTPDVSLTDPSSPLAWIAHDSSKPGRVAAGCWVAQASVSWSTEHLELELEQIKGLMMALLCERLGVSPECVRYAVAHRWRYARVVESLGRPFVRNKSGTLFAGGDWCLGTRTEDAWISGSAIAKDIVGTS